MTVRQFEIGANVKDYGARGNGTDDDTLAIIQTISACPIGKAVFFPPGTYVINQTIELTELTILQGDSAIIKGGNAKTGDLQTYGRFFAVYASDSRIAGLNFVPPVTPFDPVTSYPCSILVDNCSRVVVTDCTFIGPDVHSIFVRGDKTTDVEISHNTLTKATGITYSLAGTCRTRCIYNTIIDAPENALSGTGNNDAKANAGCIVQSNTINNPGRMGIEDWANCTDTQILDNKISGGGTATQGIAISAVSIRPLVQGNTIIDSINDAIETTGSGAIIRHNTIRQQAAERKQKATGVIINNFVQNTHLSVLIKDNTFEECRSGVVTWAQCGNVTVDTNMFRDVGTSVSAECSDPTAILTVQNNQMRYTIPDSENDGRTAINLQPSSNGLQRADIKTNHVWYEANAGNTGNDWTVRVFANSAVIDSNTFDGGGVSTPSLGGASSSYAGLQLTNNTFAGGANYDVASYSSPIVSGNTITP